MNSNESSSDFLDPRQAEEEDRAAMEWLRAEIGARRDSARWMPGKRQEARK